MSPTLLLRLPRRLPKAMSKTKRTIPAAAILIIVALEVSPRTFLTGRLDLEIWLRYSRLSIRTL